MYGQGIDTKRPVPDSVRYAVLKSGPPKQMLVVSGSPVRICSSTSPVGETTVTPAVCSPSVATHTLPSPSTANESNSCKPGRPHNKLDGSIGENCVVGRNTIIQSHAVIDHHVEIGNDCFIDAHVTITGAAKLKDRVRIHANTVIGSEGFGFAPYQGKWHRIAQLGSVRIGNDVRIGSNCSIDCGALDDTIIEDGVIIDNLVQIAHNVYIGSNTAIAAKTGIAGSTRIGKNCIVGGACGIIGHLEITDNVTLTAMSMVTKNIYEAGTYSSGIGLFENSHWKKTIVRLRQLADVPLTQISKRLDHMQAQLESLESTLKLRK